MTRRLLPLLALLSACTRDHADDEVLFLRNDGADMPVHIAGATDSGVLVVWLGSGPGDPIDIVRGAATEALEEEIGMVYWDQRGCGSAQGNPAPETFTIEQFVEDTALVVQLVQEHTGADSIFLLGHSWGGTLGTAYLLDEERQAGIAGWIDVAGNHDHPRIFPLKVDWLEGYARARIAEGVEVEHWSEVAAWAATEPALSEDAFETWDHWVGDTNAAFHDPDAGFDVDAEMLFGSGASALAYLAVNQGLAADLVYADGAQQVLAYTDRLGEITVPSLVLWGAHDGIVPLAAGEEAHALLGAPAEHRRLVVLPESAHFSFLEEPEPFAEAVLDFVWTEQR